MPVWSLDGLSWLDYTGLPARASVRMHGSGLVLSSHELWLARPDPLRPSGPDLALRANETYCHGRREWVLHV